MDRFNSFTVLLNKILRNIHRIKDEEMSKFGLKSTHLTCLYYLYKAGGTLCAKELCIESDEDKAAVSRAVEFLEKEKYIACDCENRKRYKSPLNLTEKGMDIGKRVCEKVDRFLNEASRGIDETAREILYDSLETISINLQKICERRIKNVD